MYYRQVHEMQELVNQWVEQIPGEQWAQLKSNYWRYLSELGITKRTLIDYAAYHVILGSTPRFDISPAFDLPDPLSIKTHFERVVADVLKKQQTK